MLDRVSPAPDADENPFFVCGTKAAGSVIHVSRVSEVQTMPEALQGGRVVEGLSLVGPPPSYPETPCRFGPVLLCPSAATVWQLVQGANCCSPFTGSSAAWAMEAPPAARRQIINP